MPSIWEEVGERIGYALAAVVLGPKVALERKARLRMRTAMLGWCEPLGSISLLGRKGTVRRAVMLPTSVEAIAVEIELDLAERVAYLVATIEVLPSHVQARVSKNA